MTQIYKGTVYLVGIPIGNLEDVSLRALRILKEVSLIAAEDTRKARKLLSHYQIKTPTTSYHQHNETSKLPQLLRHLTERDLALVSEAGMPSISDPGYQLVKRAREKGINVVPVPGPSAVVTALVASGLPTDRFLFLGFLSRKKRDRRQLLASLLQEPHTLVFFEAPHRLLASLGDIRDIFGQRKLAICRELTKLHEEIFVGTAEETLRHFPSPKGEFTLLVEGNSSKGMPPSDPLIASEIKKLMKAPISTKDAVEEISGKLGVSRSRVYKVARERGNAHQQNL